MDENEQPIARSTGEVLLSNLIFVSSLIQFAKQRVDDKDEFLIPGTVAPFLIDAPFGALDENYKAEAAKYLPECTEQLILLLSSSHWNTVDSHIRKYIGKEYILVNHQTTQQGDRPDDQMSINDADYKLSVYDSKVRMTAIQEIGG